MRPLPCVALALLIGLFARFPAIAVPAADYPESSEIRVTIVSSWLGAPIGPVGFLQPLSLADRYGNRFEVSQRRNAATGLLSISVIPADTDGVEGDWVLYRRLSDGLPDHIEIFPVPDPSISIEIRPDGTNPERGRSLLDLKIYGAYAAREVPLGIAFVRLYGASLASIVSMSKSTVSWDLLEPDTARYADVASAVSVVRDGLKTLVYLDDGAFDENGAPVLIETGASQDPGMVWGALSPGQNPLLVTGGVNCSGFAKWIVDGIVRPRAGMGTYVESLKSRTDAPETHFTESYRESRDLFFALDWARNLASAALSSSLRKTVRPESSALDVRAEPFPQSCVFEKNVGYRAREIEPLLYWLAIREPGHAYLGAISRERGSPPLRQYHHLVAFFPWFDAEGRFNVAVFESATETSIATFIERNDDSYAYLVRIRVPEAGYFKP